MQLALRPYMTTGVALVGASVIAVSPIAPVPDVNLPSLREQAVALAAEANPLVAYTELITNTVSNLQAIAEQILANPAPILSAILDVQRANATVLVGGAADSFNALVTAIGDLPSQLQGVVEDLQNGDIVGAIGALLVQIPILTFGLAALPLVNATLTVVNNSVQNVANVVEVLTSPITVLTVALGALLPYVAGVEGFADTTQDLVEAVTGGDFVRAAGLIVSAPANILNAALNGSPFSTPGLLNGTIPGLLTLRNTIADAITPPPTDETTLADSATDKSASSLRAFQPLGITETGLKNAVTVDLPQGQEQNASESTDTGKASESNTGVLNRLRMKTGNAAEPATPATATTPRQRATAVVSGVQDKLTVKRSESPSGLRTALSNLGKTRPDKSGADKSGATSDGDSGTK